MIIYFLWKGDYRMFSLTEREMKVLELMTKGYSNTEIGEILHISRHTAKSHVSTIIRKLGATSRASATFLAGKQNLF